MNIRHFESLASLVKSLNTLRKEEWVYANVSEWEANPEQTDFYYVPWDELQDLGDDELFENEDGAELPIEWKNLQLKEWMLVNLLQHIASKVSVESQLGKFIEEINYYREFDTFRS